MPSLADEQARFIACLQKGPDHFPDELFTEDRARALLGLKAHANTISFGRITALEAAYPKLRDHIGDDDFRGLCQHYITQPEIQTCDMNTIAAGFADFLIAQTDDRSAIDLANIEWGWLESYHSADADALTLENIATLAEADLLALPINAHPAMRVIALDAPLSSQLSELGPDTPDGVLVARPQAEVLFHRLDKTDLALGRDINKYSSMSNFLVSAIELGGEDAAMERIIRFIQAGAIIYSGTTT